MVRHPTVGSTVKVHIPGESPWAECIAVHDDGTWEGKILNHLVGQMSDAERTKISEDHFGISEALPSLHNFKCGDVITFGIETIDDFSIWSPVHVEQGTA